MLKKKHNGSSQFNSSVYGSCCIFIFIVIEQENDGDAGDNDDDNNNSDASNMKFDLDFVASQWLAPGQSGTDRWKQRVGSLKHW